MDVSDISKVASRTRMKADAEKLREKVSRETAKIIKLKVAQDTAYWDLKEKLAQTERNRERLQQNMVDVQMQLEATSAQNQRELCMRPDTLNKVSGARGMCDVLEAYAARLRRGVERARADQTALAAAYGDAARRVRAQAAGAARARLRARLDARNHADAERAAAERLRACEARAGAVAREADEARKAAAAARDAAAEAAAARADLAARLDACALQLQRREESASAMQEEARRLVREYEARIERMQSAVGTRDRELKEAMETNSALRAALERQERAVQEQRALSERLQERAAATQKELQDAKMTVERLNKEIVVLTDNNKVLEEADAEKYQQVEYMIKETKTMTERLERSEAERRKLEEELEKMNGECAAKTASLEDATRAAAALQAKFTDAEAAYKRQLAAELRRVEELSASSSRLANALASEREERARADAAAEASHRRAVEERDALAARHATLEALLAAKEAELAAQMNIILDLRDEKERLQERIRGERITIENIRKTLAAGGEPAPQREAGERPHEAARAMKARAARSPDSLDNFLSDGSIDGDSLDAAEVNRRFEALGRAHQPRAAHAPHAQSQKPVSLAQVKNEMKMKRTFFKNKRHDAKPKKNNK